MGTIRKKGLAVCMMALLAILGMTVSAERPQETGNAETIGSLSGGDAAGEQIMPYADGVIASDTDNNDNIDWKIDASGRLTVTGTGNLAGDLSSGTYAWKSWSSQITSAVVNVSGMTNASYLFSGCSSMTSIDISGLDTSLVTNMGGMFEGCSSLTSIDLSGFDTSNVTQMSSMFSGCSSLTSLDLSNLNTSKVFQMLGMFEGCSSLASLNLSGFDTSAVVDMASMFSRCSGLTSLNLGGIDTSGVRDMRWMFEGCSSLTSLDLSGFDTGNVVQMSHMFEGCSSLTNLDLSSFNTGNVMYMSGMFSECGSLASLNMGNLNTSSVDDMSNMFYGCGDLVSLDLGSFDTSGVFDMDGMFENCSSLASLDISNFNLGSVMYMSRMLDNCSSLLTLHAPGNVNLPVSLPVVAGTSWSLPDGTVVTELPQGVSASVTLIRSGTPDGPGIITTTPDLNMEDVIRVKYVTYSYTVETNNIDPDNIVTFSVAEGRLADGLLMYPATGEIYGVPTEAGEFNITVMAVYSNPAYLPSYAELVLTVLDNTDSNVGLATDPGYDITQPVTGFNVENIVGNGAQTLISQGEYSEFRDVYIDGKKLTEGQDYTSEAGSTRITIMNQTLADGGTGTHTLGIEFRTEGGVLKRAAQNYVIRKGTDSDNTGNPGNSGGNTGNQTNNSNNNSNNAGNNNGNAGNGVNLVPTVPTEVSQQDFIIYIVERNDSLWKIAVKFYGEGNSWRKIYEDNKAVIRSPGRLYAGQRLMIRLPGVTAAPSEETVTAAATIVTQENIYVVQKGDMLWSIAARVYGDGKLWTVIYEANKDVIKNPECIRAGQVLNIPHNF